MEKEYDLIGWASDCETHVANIKLRPENTNNALSVGLKTLFTEVKQN